MDNFLLSKIVGNQIFINLSTIKMRISFLEVFSHYIDNINYFFTVIQIYCSQLVLIIFLKKIDYKSI